MSAGNFKILFFLGFLLYLGNLNAQTNCEIMHQGTFVYNAETNPVKVVIDGVNHTEYHSGGKYHIKSTIEWVNECEYNMTMTEVTIPKFPYQKGAIMNVKITEVKGNDVYYAAAVEGRSWQGVFTKME